ncbi:Uncharacterized protein dnm_052450 [Desulfonema magnum]|uniref:Uncharacterized protein n=1 Tax=Desulfonema magnum TaxID=45655 RepID=A0A975BPG3_9BACT|nr:Uncharacterized protein dnm_052450 [Desulfonema magnum]
MVFPSIGIAILRNAALRRSLLRNFTTEKKFLSYADSFLQKERP